MKGEIAEGVVPGLMREIYVGRRSGSLTLVRGDERQSLRFRRGHLVNSQTNVVHERLGEMMVRVGLLSEADLARATEVVLRERRRLGEVLLELGLVDGSRLEDAVARHVHEMLARAFSWTEGSYSFDDEPAEEGSSELTLKLSTGELILEAVRAVRDPAAVRYALGDLDRVLALSNDPLLRFQKLTLSPSDGFVLSRVDGATSAREIVQMIPLPAEEAERSLFGLLSTGVVEFTEAHSPREAQREATAAPATAPTAPPPPAPTEPEPLPTASEPATPEDERSAEKRLEILEAWEGLRTRTHFEVLGLARTAGEAEVKDAYFRLARRFHPDVHHGASLGDLQDKLEAVFIRLGEAYEVLKDQRRRTDYEERLGRPRPRAAEVTAPPGPAGAVASSEPAPPPPDQEEETRLDEQAVARAARLLDQARTLEQEKPDQPDHQRLTFDAIQLLEPVVEKDRLTGRTRVRAQILLARGWAKNPRWAKRAEELLLRATRESPGTVEGWALLGALYAQRGLKARATSMYRKVLELKPDDEEATQYVAANAASAEPPDEQGGGGLLGRLFRRG